MLLILWVIVCHSRDSIFLLHVVSYQIITVHQTFLSLRTERHTIEYFFLFIEDYRVKQCQHVGKSRTMTFSSAGGPLSDRGSQSLTRHVGAKPEWRHGGVSAVYGAPWDGWPQLLPVYLWLSDLSLLLAPHPHRREWPLPCLPEGLPGKPCRLQALVAWRVSLYVCDVRRLYLCVCVCKRVTGWDNYCLCKRWVLLHV